MQRFKFTLQAVHDLREITRDEAERALTNATSEVTKATIRLEETVHLRLSATRAYVAKLQSRDLDPFEAQQRASYIASLTQREADTRRQLDILEREREQIRTVVVEASRDVETTSKLRSKQQAVHVAKTLSTEQNMMDEMATIAVARRHSEHA
jgi:flagellar export protein FliJ